MIQISQMFLLIGLACIFFFVALLISQKQSRLFDRLEIYLFAAYFVWLLMAFFRPYQVDFSVPLLTTPEFDLSKGIFTMKQLYMTLAFIPFGYLFCDVFGYRKKPVKLVLQALLISVFAQTSCWLFHFGPFSIDALLCSVVGSALGYLFYEYLYRKDSLVVRKTHLVFSLKKTTFIALCVNLVLGVTFIIGFFQQTTSFDDVLKEYETHQDSVLIDEPKGSYRFLIVENPNKEIFLDLYHQISTDYYQKTATFKTIKEDNSYYLVDGIEGLNHKRILATKLVYGKVPKESKKVDIYYENIHESCRFEEGAFLSFLSRNVEEDAISELRIFASQDEGKPVYVNPIEGQLIDHITKPIADDLVLGVYPLMQNTNILHNGNENKRFVPASVAKLITVYYALEYLDPDEVIEIRHDVVSQSKPDSSLANLTPGHMKVKDVVAGMMVPSGNDAAYVLAIATDEKHYKERLPYQQAMERYLKDLNKFLEEHYFFDTTITDPSGYEEDSYTSFQDINRCALILVQKDWFFKIVSSPYYQVTSEEGKVYSWKNTNKLLDPSSRYYLENVKGVKTGSLDYVRNLMTLVEKNGKYYIIDVFQAESLDDRYIKARKLINAIP